MRRSELFYAVQLPSVLRRRGPRLALGETSGPRLHYHRGAALAFKRRLISEGFPLAKVVPVRVTYTWPA